MPFWLLTLVGRLGVPERLAKPVLIAALIAVAILGPGIAKCCYDRSIIAKHDAAASTEALTRDASAKDQAAVERRADDRRISDAQKGLTDAIAQAPATAPDPAHVALACERLRRQGTGTADLPGACRP